MIVSFRHKGLRLLYEKDDGSKLPPALLERIRSILSFLDASERVEDMDQPTLHLHPLKGDLRGKWAVTVRSNWRIVFRYSEAGAEDIDFMDYH
jgi:proteic killer suppression protein